MKQMAKTEAQKRSQFIQQVQCPICLRSFNSRAADDHIKFCQEKSKRDIVKKKWGKPKTKPVKKEMVK